MRRISAILFAICLFATPSFAAHTGTWIAGSTWEGYGAPSPLATSPNIYYGLYPYQVNYPQCYSILTISNPPWDPNGVGGVDHYLEGFNGSTITCAPASPNPAQGVYFRENQPHRGHDVVFWMRINGNITTNTFILRLNDSTHGITTGVFLGAIDYSAPFIDTSNKLNSDIPGDSGSSAALTPGTWYQVEYCYVSGTSGSGTVPPDEKFWLNGTQFLTFGNGTTPNNIGGGDTITFDTELGSGGTIDFGPWADFDPGSSCPATALATLYAVAYGPTSNGAVQFTPSANTNWQNAAATSPGALGYNADSTEGQIDIYNMTLGTHTNILGITQRASVEKTASGVRESALGWHIGSTNYICADAGGFSLGGESPAYIPGVASSLQQGTFQQQVCSTAIDPSTSSSWSGATDAAHVLIKVSH